MRFAVFAAAATAALWLWTSRKITPWAAMAALSLVTTVDLWMVGKKFFQTTPRPEEMYAADDVTSFLKSQPGPFRIFPVPGQSAWPGLKNYPMLYRLDQAGGEHGNQLQRYNEFAGPGPSTVYVDFHNLGDPRFLAAGNVRYG
jgi:hypothetical protein